MRWLTRNAVGTVPGLCLVNTPCYNFFGPSHFQVASLIVVTQTVIILYECTRGLEWVMRSLISSERVTHPESGPHFLDPLFFPTANSKSEGSPVLPHEPSKVKPEESRDITRPSRPAVSASLTQGWTLLMYDGAHRVRRLARHSWVQPKLLRWIRTDFGVQKAIIPEQQENGPTWLAFLAFRGFNISTLLANETGGGKMPTIPSFLCSNLGKMMLKLEVKETWTLCLIFLYSALTL